MGVVQWSEVGLDGIGMESVGVMGVVEWVRLSVASGVGMARSNNNGHCGRLAVGMAQSNDDRRWANPTRAP